jgi:dTDP-4-amino-4,6-dideoxy-D-galactose acyltransferase
MSQFLNQLQILNWDSEFLGYPVARLEAHCLKPVELASQVAAAQNAGIRLVYLIAAPADEVSNASACQTGAWLADRKVTFAMPVSPSEREALHSPAIQATTTWTPELESLALQSGEYSRFRLDKRFSSDVFPHLYQQWLRNSLAHQLAREVLVFTVPTEFEARPKHVGLLTLGMKNGRADIGLLAVDERARGQRIGQQLVAAAKQRTATWGFNELQVVTQLDNVAACGFYQHCGFHESQVEHIYHLWL